MPARVGVLRRRASRRQNSSAKFIGEFRRNLTGANTTDLFAAIARDLVGREATKGIIRFELDEPVPEAVVRRLAAWNPADGATTGRGPILSRFCRDPGLSRDKSPNSGSHGPLRGHTHHITNVSLSERRYAS
jgi:hypothetical protein